MAIPAVKQQSKRSGYLMKRMKRTIIAVMVLIFLGGPTAVYASSGFSGEGMFSWFSFFQSYQQEKTMEEEPAISYYNQEVRDFNVPAGQGARQVPVLMYHHILPSEHNHYNSPAVLNLESFEAQMQYLADAGFVTLTLKEFERFLNGELRIPEKSLLITFDDGYQSETVYAEPVLRQHGFTAASFLITDYIPSTTANFRHDRLTYKSMDEVHQSLDVFEYGSHTQNLHYFENESVNRGAAVTKSYESVWHDIHQSREVIPSPYFAYPYGHYNSTLIGILENLDYRLAFTTQEVVARPSNDPYKIGRFAITPSVRMGRFQQIVNQ